jgi:Ca2+-binding RTX toxin-like protein
MRRAISMVATMAMSLLVASGVALAVTKIGTNGPDTLRGTNGPDNLIGKGGNDELFSLAGDDTLLGGPGKDVVWGGKIVGSCCQDNDFSGGDKNVVGGPGNDDRHVVFAPDDPAGVARHRAAGPENATRIDATLSGIQSDKKDFRKKWRKLLTIMRNLV